MSKISTIATSVVALFVLDIIYHFLSLAISRIRIRHQVIHVHISKVPLVAVLIHEWND
jgi:hypothetical protein